MLGAVLSTANVALGCDSRAEFPATSVAVPDAIRIPKVPFPEMPEIVTVRVAVPDPVTATVPFAVPVLFSVMLLASNETALTPLPPESA